VEKSDSRFLQPFELLRHVFGECLFDVSKTRITYGICRASICRALNVLADIHPRQMARERKQHGDMARTSDKSMGTTSVRDSVVFVTLFFSVVINPKPRV
jgi:hypothetical protein